MKEGEVRVDLKAEIEKRIRSLKRKSEKYYAAAREADNCELALFTGIFCQAGDEIQFLIDLLKHEAFQTTEPCMTKVNHEKDPNKI